MSTAKTLFLSILCFLTSIHCNALKISDLRIESLTVPTFVDADLPAFSWKISSEERGTMQTSYCINVYSDKNQKNLIWSSGTVKSSQQTNVKAASLILQPSTVYYWNVTVGDNKGNTEKSARTESFTTGLMHSGWSGAQWITTTKMPLNGSEDISATKHYAIDFDMTLLKDNAALMFAVQTSREYHFWQLNCKDKDVPMLRRHIIYYTKGADVSEKLLPQYSKSDFINHEHHFTIDVNGNIVKTLIDNKLVDEYTDNSGILDEGLVGFRVNQTGDLDEQAYFDNLKVTDYKADGTPVTKLQDDFSDTANSVFLNAETTSIGGNSKCYMHAENGENKLTQIPTDGESYFRKAFTLKSGIRKVYLYASALGIYNILVNGKNINDKMNKSGYENMLDYSYQGLLLPGWTNYEKRIQYSSFDITPFVNKGLNAIGAEVAAGWWYGHISHWRYGSNHRGFIAKMLIEYNDGTSETVVTDLSWACSQNGPLKMGDIYDGEIYDARLSSDWSKPSYDDRAWKKVTLHGEFKGDIVSFKGPQVNIIDNGGISLDKAYLYEGVKKDTTAYGAVNIVKTFTSNSSNNINIKRGQTLIIDFGQNFAGQLDFSVKGAKGTRMHIQFSEMLNDNGSKYHANDGPAGSLYLRNLRSAKAEEWYILNGNKNQERHQPTTTFFGYRYCSITASDDIVLNDIKGLAISSAPSFDSKFETSDALVNKLYSNIKWGERSNLLSVPTDCPQRDERLGWTGDTQAFSLAGMYNENLQSFYQKWMTDMCDTQWPNGLFQCVAPNSWDDHHGGSGWSDAGIIVPWNVYTMYGDTTIISQNYKGMEKYMNYLSTNGSDEYKYEGPEPTFGDWLAYDQTDKRYISVAYYAYDAQIMAKMSAALSHDNDDLYARKSAKYNELFKNIRNEFQQRYFADGKLKFETQTAFLLALKFNLLINDEQKAYAKKRLEELITKNGERLSTGFLGTTTLNQTLSEFGLSDKAYNLLLQRQNPSWLYPIDQGATTMWERWNSYTKDKGFGDSGMNSFNHYAYGAVGEWLFRYMAGISFDVQQPGFKHIILQPQPDLRTSIPEGQKRITNTNASYKSQYGSINSDWKQQQDGSLVYDFTVPANTTATLYLPAKSADATITESGKNASTAEGVTYEGYKNGKAVFNLASGTYHFTVK